MMKHTILILSFLAAASLSLALKGAQIIDGDSNFDVEKVAEVVCDVTKGSSKQIGRADTVGKLAGFFKTLPASHKLAKCNSLYGKSVANLQQVLETGNGNVCGNDKLTAIEQFHRRYVSGVKKYKKEREANGWLAPQLIKLVFMHYAHKVSSICEKSAAQELAQVAEKMAVETSSEESDHVMGQISEVAGVSDLSKGYDSVFSLWSLLDKLPVEKSEKFSHYLRTGDQSGRRLTIAVQQAAKLGQIQEQCAQVMRPIYARSLLGVLRLVDMGYYPEEELLVKEVRESPASKRLFVMVQVCEILLPIALVEDATLSPEQIVMLPKDEHENTRTMPNQLGDYTEVAENSLKDLTELELAEQDNAKSLSKLVKKAVRRRDDATKLIFRSMINCFKAKIKSKMGSMLMANGGLRERAIDEDLAGLNESDLASLIQEDSEPETSGLSRRKRSFSKTLDRIVDSLLYLVRAAIALVALTIYFAIFVTLVLGLDAFYYFTLKLTGIKVEWIKSFERFYLKPLFEVSDKFKKNLAKDDA